MSRRPAAPPQEAASVPATARDRSLRWTFVLLLLATVLAYLPAFSAGFIWDDSGHVTRADLQSFSGLSRIWFEVGATQQYYPLLHSAFWVEHRLWGDSPAGYHAINVLLHASAACLFAVVLMSLGVRGAQFAALLFALHPVGVESVAWISEQKNTLSTVLYLAAALAYLRFDAGRRPSRYALATGLFVLALLTKTVTATLPAALLVLLWWKRGRLEWRRDVAPLMPWLALGAIAGLLTARFESVLIGAQGADFNLSVVQRVLLAGRVFWFYLGKLAWPSHLIFIYPRWTIDTADFGAWIYPASALALLVGLFAWRRRSRAPLAAALLFVGMLFPVLGFVNVFPFLFSYVADHFQYLPSLPIFALAAAGLTLAAVAWPRPVRFAAAGMLLAVLGLGTFKQATTYHDEFTLFQDTLEKNPACWMAHHNLAIALAGSGQVEPAISHLETVLKLHPNYAPAENNLGDDLSRLGRNQEAVSHLERALQLQPDYAAAENNLGMAFAQLNRTNDAVPHFTRAAKLDPRSGEYALNLAVAVMLQQGFDAARPQFERAVALAPNSLDVHDLFARALQQAGRLDDARMHYAEVVRLAPTQATAQMNLALILRQLGREEEAKAHYVEAIRLDPSLEQRR